MPGGERRFLRPTTTNHGVGPSEIRSPRRGVVDNRAATHSASRAMPALPAAHAELCTKLYASIFHATRVRGPPNRARRTCMRTNDGLCPRVSGRTISPCCNGGLPSFADGRAMLADPEISNCSALAAPHSRFRVRCGACLGPRFCADRWHRPSPRMTVHYGFRAESAGFRFPPRPAT